VLSLPRYFFNIHDGKDIIDNEGTELSDLAQARSDAVDLAGRTIAELGDAFWIGGGDWRLEVTDETRKVLFVLRFSSEEPST
jgi:hypothetical protein